MPGTFSSMDNQCHYRTDKSLDDFVVQLRDSQNIGIKSDSFDNIATYPNSCRDAKSCTEDGLSVIIDRIAL
jgi:hypothetical protein